MEAETSLVWADGVVELHPVAGVGLDLAVVIHPCHAECEDSVRFNEALNDLGILELRVFVVNILN